MKRPKNLLGAAVGKLKLHNKTTHKGTIILTFREKRSKITLWRVQYDDGDISDYNIAEIAPLLEKLSSHCNTPEKYKM
jgi:hypothetical protein